MQVLCVLIIQFIFIWWQWHGFIDSKMDIAVELTPGHVDLDINLYSTPKNSDRPGAEFDKATVDN